jgi:outer membrane receptor for Fe3+-dicitrate
MIPRPMRPHQWSVTKALPWAAGFVLAAAAPAAADPPTEAELEAELREVVASYVLQPRRPVDTASQDYFDFAPYLPGFTSRPFDGSEEVVPNYSLRGLPDPGKSQYVCVMLDGIPVAPMHYGRTELTIMPAGIERIDGVVLRTGVDGMLLAPNTMGGSIDFRTAPIPHAPFASLETKLGSDVFRSLGATAGGTWGRFGCLGTLLDDSGHGFHADDEFSLTDLSFKAHYDLAETRRITATVSYMDDQYKVPGGRTVVGYESNPFWNPRPLDKGNADRFLLQCAYRSGPLDGAYWEAFANGSRLHRKLHAQRPEFGTPDSMESLHDDAHHAEIGVRGQVPFDLGGASHVVRGAVRHYREWLPRWEQRTGPFPDGGGPLTTDANYDARAVSAFVDDTIDVSRRLRIVPGLRAEWILRANGEDPVAGWSFDNDYSLLLPSLTASFAVTDRLALFGGWTEGFRAPQVYALVTDPDVDVERSRTFELGCRGRARDGVYGSLVGWTAAYDDVADLSTGTYVNLGRVRATGGDLVLGWDLGERWPGVRGLDVSMTLSLQDSELEDGNRVPFTWQRKASWMVRYERGRWAAFLGGSYVGDSYSDLANTETSNAQATVGRNPSRTLWDARVARRFPVGEKGGADLALGVTNFLDETWYAHSDGGFFGGGRVVAPPLRAYLGISLDLTW